MSYEKLDVYQCAIQFLAAATFVDERRAQHAKDLLHRIVSMLTKLSRA